MKEKVNDALKEHFRPEFLNRIDDTIVFHELSKAEVTQIVDLMIKRVDQAAREPGPRPGAHPGGQDSTWPTRATTRTLGARPLRRAIQRLVEDPLSERLLWKEFRAGETIIVDAEVDPESPGRDGHHLPRHRGLRAPARRAGRHRHRRHLTCRRPWPAPLHEPPGPRCGGARSRLVWADWVARRAE